MNSKMWISRKINSIFKHQKSTNINLFHHHYQHQYHTQQCQSIKQEAAISFVLGITASVNQTGKSSLVQCLELIETNKHGLYRLKSNEQFIIQIIEYTNTSAPPTNIKALDGIFICYDTTNRDSMDDLPDIINTFISHNVPCLLIGLKSDLTLQRTVDPQLGHLIGNLFGVQAIEADTVTQQGIQLLQKHFIQFIYSDKELLMPQCEQLSVTSTPVEEEEEEKEEKEVEEPVYNTNLSVKPMSRNNSNNSQTNGYETAADIVDQVINNTEDANGVAIFLTVFRKFMKPFDLATLLIQKFEFDLINQDHHFRSETTNAKFILPTSRQERIRSFFCLWLSHYWGDFKSSATRRIILDFLERISNYQELATIRDVITPLALREPALCDKDAYWGMSDLSDKEKKQRKKDSGYGEWTSPILTSTTLKRAASTNTYTTITPRLAFKSIISFNTPSRQDDEEAETYAANGRRNSTPVSLNHYLPPTPVVRFGGGNVLYSAPPRTKSSLLLIDPHHTFDVITSISAQYIAEQLTFVEQELFRKIQPRDFLRYLWTPPTAKRDSNPLLASIENFNFVSGWIASLIVDQVNIEKRILVFEACLRIAVELRAMHNFNTLMAVLAGINSAAVLRLKQTRILVRLKNKKLFDQFLELEILMSSERSFYQYRAALKQTEFPGIPYLGIHQQDLVSLGEANKDHKMDGKVHWKKFRLMGECILEMIRFQYPTYTSLVPEPTLLYFIGHQSTAIMTEDERYEKSMEIEPKSLKPSPSTSSSTSSRWLTSIK